VLNSGSFCSSIVASRCCSGRMLSSSRMKLSPVAYFKHLCRGQHSRIEGHVTAAGGTLACKLWCMPADMCMHLLAKPRQAPSAAVPDKHSIVFVCQGAHKGASCSRRGLFENIKLLTDAALPHQ
jgi:hypothetical protein